MLFWIFKITIISIVLIFLVHHLLIFFKSTLTVPKIKDMVHVQDDLINSINSLKTTQTTIDNPTNINSMKDDLKFFLKNKMKTV